MQQALTEIIYNMNDTFDNIISSIINRTQTPKTSSIVTDYVHNRHYSRPATPATPAIPTTLATPTTPTTLTIPLRIMHAPTAPPFSDYSPIQYHLLSKADLEDDLRQVNAIILKYETMFVDLCKSKVNPIIARHKIITLEHLQFCKNYAARVGDELRNISNEDT